MKKIVDDARLIYKCCYLYYVDGMGQREICDAVGISRATVSRLLRAGKETGVVKIELENPDSVLYGELERKVEQLLGLKEVLIVDELELESKADHLQHVYEEALMYLSRIINKGDTIGVSMGKTLSSIVNVKKSVDEVDCTFVPVVGGVGSPYQIEEGYHSNDIAKGFAMKFHGKAMQFFAPAMFDDPKVMQGFLKEKPVREVVSVFKKLKTVIMGIGTTTAKEPTLVKCGYLTKEDYEEFQQQGAVGDILLKYVDANGNSDAFRSFNERVMGMSDEKLLNVKNRVGIAVGADKGEAVLGVIRAKKVNILLTDISCIRSMMSLLGEEI